MTDTTETKPAPAPEAVTAYLDALDIAATALDDAGIAAQAAGMERWPLGDLETWGNLDCMTEDEIALPPREVMARMIAAHVDANGFIGRREQEGWFEATRDAVRDAADAVGCVIGFDEVLYADNGDNATLAIPGVCVVEHEAPEGEQRMWRRSADPDRIGAPWKILGSAPGVSRLYLSWPEVIAMAAANEVRIASAYEVEQYEKAVTA